MTTVLTSKNFALLAVLTLGVSACSALGTSVAEDDPETEVPNVSMGRAVMEGLGAVKSRDTAINYTPRSPLVVPPNKLALAPPEDANTVAASGNWPVDNDEKARKNMAEVNARDAARGDKDALTPSELMAVRLPATSSSTAVATTSMDDQAKPLLPSEIGKMSKANANSLYDQSGKPIRKALVEPPVAYLEPAAGVPVTTDDGSPTPTKKSWWKFW